MCIETFYPKRQNSLMFCFILVYKGDLSFTLACVPRIYATVVHVFPDFLILLLGTLQLKTS